MPNNRSNAIVKSAGRQPDAWSHNAIKHQPKPNANTGFSGAGHRVTDTKPVKLFDVNEGRQAGMNFNTSSAKFVGGVLALGVFASSFKVAEGQAHTYPDTSGNQVPIDCSQEVSYYSQPSPTFRTQITSMPIVVTESIQVRQEYTYDCSPLKWGWSYCSYPTYSTAYRTATGQAYAITSTSTGNDVAACHSNGTITSTHYDGNPPADLSPISRYSVDELKSQCTPCPPPTEPPTTPAPPRTVPFTSNCDGLTHDWGNVPCDSHTAFGVVASGSNDAVICDTSTGSSYGCQPNTPIPLPGQSSAPAGNYCDALPDNSNTARAGTYDGGLTLIPQVDKCFSTPIVPEGITGNLNGICKQAKDLCDPPSSSAIPIPTPTLTSSTAGLATSALILASSETSSTSPEPTSTPTAEPTEEPTTPDRQGLPPKPPADGGGNNAGAAAGGVVAGLTALGAAGAAAGAVIHHRNKKKNRVFFNEPITLRQLETRVKAAEEPPIYEEVSEV